MTRRVFYSFHYKPDCFRVSQVRNIGAIEGNSLVSDNDWESITRGGDPAIQRWIDAQLTDRSCTVVLIGTATAGRKWINYEIEKSWNSKMGVVGIHIHNLLDSQKRQCVQGSNPFHHLTLKRDNRPLSSVVRSYNPPYTDSKATYSYICNNIQRWIEEAISIRRDY